MVFSGPGANREVWTEIVGRLDYMVADFNTPSAAFDAEDVSPQIEDMKLDPPDPPEPPAERNLMSGWVSTRRNSNSPSAKPQKLWLF